MNRPVTKIDEPKIIRTQPKITDGSPVESYSEGLCKKMIPTINNPINHPARKENEFISAFRVISRIIIAIIAPGLAAIASARCNELLKASMMDPTHTK